MAVFKADGKIDKSGKKAYPNGASEIKEILRELAERRDGTPQGERAAAASEQPSGAQSAAEADSPASRDDAVRAEYISQLEAASALSELAERETAIDLTPQVKPAPKIVAAKPEKKTLAPKLEYRVEPRTLPASSGYAPHIIRAESRGLGALRPILGALAILAFFSMGAYAVYAGAVPPHVESVSVADTVNDDETITVTVKPAGSWMAGGSELYCLLTDSETAPSADDSRWKLAENGSCSFDVNIGNFRVYVKDKRGNISVPDDEEFRIDRVLAVKLDRNKLYLPLEGAQTVSADVLTIGDIDDGVKWESSDTSVARVSEGKVEGVGVGSATITATAVDGAKGEVTAVVTDLITVPNWHTSEKRLLDYRYVPKYTEEQAALLDEILFDRVEQGGGLNTRGGVVAAARFITLEFPYKVAYFFENGRLNPHAGRPYADGEGRFYHRGLYLTESKFDILDPEGIRYGPATWGSMLLNFETKYAFVGGQRYPNGLDCSGFVSWVLRNGGCVVGDRGAGDEYGDNDLCDLAPLEWLSDSYLKSDEPRVGDLIAEDGHMAIIMGMTEDEIWIAESLFTNVRVTHFKRGYPVIGSGLYTYVVPMDDIYDGDGNFTEMWTELGWPDSEREDD